MPQITTSSKTGNTLIPVTMISHGTLNSVDLQESRRFYEQVLGFEVVQVSPVSLILRLGTEHTYVVVETGKLGHMEVLDHNGLDVPSREDVDKAHRVLTEVKDEYGVRRINRALDQHGSYSFYFQDLDANWWEIAARNSLRGYSWVFEEEPTRDLTGRTDIDADLVEHVFDDEYAARLRGAGR